MTNHKAFTIIEFMIAITLGVVIVFGLAGLYGTNKRSYHIQEGLARIQENGRFLTYHTNKVIRMAAYQGCANDGSITLNNIVLNPSAQVSFDKPIMGYQATGSTWSPSLPTHLQGKNIKPGTDILEIRTTSDLGIRLSHNMPNVNSALVLADIFGDGNLRRGIDQDDVVVITNCEVGDIFAAGGNASATSISHSNSNNTTTSLSTAYTNEAKVLVFEYQAFYIKNSGRTNANGDIIYALVSQDTNGVETELADGVEDLQITYGVDSSSNGSADTYQTADVVESNNNWPNVVSIEFNKLLNSVENVSPSPQAYTFNGVTTTPTDNLLRREWVSFINVRNRSLQ